MLLNAKAQMICGNQFRILELNEEIKERKLKSLDNEDEFWKFISFQEKIIGLYENELSQN